MAHRGNDGAPYWAAVGLARLAAEQYDIIEPRFLSSGYGDPTGVSARRLLNGVYLMITESKSEEEREEFDELLNDDPSTLRQRRQAQRRAAIVALGGEVVA